MVEGKCGAGECLFILYSQTILKTVWYSQVNLTLCLNTQRDKRDDSIFGCVAPVISHPYGEYNILQTLIVFNALLQSYKHGCYSYPCFQLLHLVFEQLSDIMRKRKQGQWTLLVPAAWVMCIQHGAEHSTCSLNLFQPVSYHASVTLFTYNYILPPLSVFSFSFPALVSAFSRSSQKQSWVALQHLKATRHLH